MRLYTLPGSQETPPAQQEAMVRAEEDRGRHRSQLHASSTEGRALNGSAGGPGQQGYYNRCPGAEDMSAYLGPVHFTNLWAPFMENSVGKVPPKVHTRQHPWRWSILYGGSCPVYICPGKMLSVVNKARKLHSVRRDGCSDNVHEVKDQAIILRFCYYHNHLYVTCGNTAKCIAHWL